MTFGQLVLCYKEFPSLFLSCFQNLIKIVNFFFFERERFLGHFRGNNMDSGLPKGSPVSFYLRTTWN